MKFLAILVVVLNLQNSLSLNLHCTFREYHSHWDTHKQFNTTNGTRYTCIAENLTTSVLDRTVINLVGNHSDRKSNDDVKKVFIGKQNCPYLPLGIGKLFKNLEIYYVEGSNVSRLTKDDLNEMPKLKILDLSRNPITNLTRDYFQGHDSIEIIAFFDCKLTFIEKGALDSLVNLAEGHLHSNICVDYLARDRSQIPELKKRIEKCQYEESTTESLTSTEIDETTTESGTASIKHSVGLSISIALTGSFWFLK
jgi:Leucine-rich repeat (LRR) protein